MTLIAWRFALALFCRCRAGYCRGGRPAAAGAAAADRAGGLRAGGTGLDRHHRRRGPRLFRLGPAPPTTNLALPRFRFSTFAKRARRRTFSARATASASASSISASFSSARRAIHHSSARPPTIPSSTAWAMSTTRFRSAALPISGRCHGYGCAAKFAKALAARPASPATSSSMPSCRSGNGVFRRTADDAANGRGDLALFQHHAAQLRGNRRCSRLAAAAGLQCQRRALLLRRRHARCNTVHPAMDGPRLRRISSG